MSSPSLVALRQLADLADRFDAACRQGQIPRIEDYLAEAPSSQKDDVLSHLLAIEVEIRRANGETPGASEYQARFPAAAEVVARAFFDPGERLGELTQALKATLSPTMPMLEGYEIIRFLGSGGFSEVWLAADSNLFDREVALKMIKPHTSAEARASALKTLRAEAELLVNLRHPNVIQIFGWVESDAEAALVLQYIPGGSLADRLEREGPLDWKTAARYVADVGEGLQSVHSRGLVHRDVKPANILWDRDNDEALLTDLGVGARVDRSAPPAGTIPYMAPEAFDGKISPAIDVYALAATLFTLITGRKPFSGPTIAEYRRQTEAGLPPGDPRCAAMPEAIEQIIRAGLTAEPERRPGLRDFVATLRTSLNQLLADSLATTARIIADHVEPTTEPATGSIPSDHGVEENDTEPTTERQTPASVPPHIHLIVKRQVGHGAFVPLVAAHSPSSLVSRDMTKVPASPDQVSLRTGDRIRIEIVADRAGHFSVFNIGPTGNLNLLFPEEEPAAGGVFTSPLIPANYSIVIRDIEMTPPAGCERLFAVWSRQPLPLPLEKLHSLVEGKESKYHASRPYVATRDIKRVKQSLQKIAPADWHAAVLELKHEA